MIAKSISSYLATIGAKGGRKSRRELTSHQAREMVRKRESKRKEKALADFEAREAQE